MKFTPRPLLLSALIACTPILLTPTPLLAHDDAGYARRARLMGRALPLQQILDKVHRVMPGEVVKVELESEHYPSEQHPHKLQYEIKVLAHDGRLMEVKLDARTGEVTEIEQDD